MSMNGAGTGMTAATMVRALQPAPKAQMEANTVFYVGAAVSGTTPTTAGLLAAPTASPASGATTLGSVCSGLCNVTLLPFYSFTLGLFFHRRQPVAVQGVANSDLPLAESEFGNPIVLALPL